VREAGFERPRVLEASELAALQQGGATVLREAAMTQPLVIEAQKAEDYGLSNGTVQSLDQLAEVLTIDPATIGELTTNWAEQMVGWLELFQPFLLVAGFVLILFEVKTPGVGLPGLLGVLFLGLAMFHSYLTGLAEITEILVFFLGLAAIAVEIFLLPGTLIFGAVGFLCLLLALVLSRQSFVLPSNALEEDLLLANLTNLTLLIVTVLVLGVATWRLLPRLPWFNRLFLRPPERALQPAGGGQSGMGLGDAALTALVGRSGTAATVLRPTGTMELDGERVDVVTEGEFVEPGTAIRVLYVQGTRVVVAAADDPRSGERGSVGVVVLLAIVGLALLVAEVFFVSFGVIAVLSGLSLITAVFFAFQQSTAFGVTMLVIEAIAAPVVLALAFRLLPRTRFGKQLILTGPETPGSAAAADPELERFLHKTGVTLSPLRPAGFARIDGRKVDVVTRGEMIDANCPVKVLDVAQNRVVVGRC
jgi:membrane-bound ClpP family serine protease